MNFELELVILLATQTLGFAIFRKFEIETHWLRTCLKWAIMFGITYLLYRNIGHWAILFIAFMLSAGLIFHFTWCKINKIHPLNATPRKKYYGLRGWDWKE